LAAVARPGDTIARFGGDEFVVLCENLPRPEAVVGIADRIAAALDEPFQIGGTEALFITASIGIALTTGKRTSAEALTRDADAAMYRAKEQGRARFQLFDAELRHRVIERMESENAIRWAIERHELRVHYQPVVELSGGEVVGFEALVRWQHPERGLLGAESLIPYALESTLIVAIGDFVLDAACRQLAAWATGHEKRRPVWISVNVAARQLADHGFLERVQSCLRLAGPAAERLHLEITEATLIAEGTSSARRIAELDELGVRLVLDDFGTGYSALSYLQRFPLDAIKIDRSFISHLPEGRPQRALVGGIVSIAHALGLTIVAEGIETTAQADVARELGCELAQGFLFGRPDGAEAARVLIEPEPAATGHSGHG
jgi:predicted signal transduction protein with EAL and GGDEF domain